MYEYVAWLMIDPWQPLYPDRGVYLDAVAIRVVLSSVYGEVEKVSTLDNVPDRHPVLVFRGN